MTRRTWTEHKLTDAQLRRLSAICKPDGGGPKHGMARLALERKGLVIAVDHGSGFLPVYKRWQYVATDAGRKALEQARREGW